MKREIVLYKDARGKECICEAQEYDAVWAREPNVKLIERGQGWFHQQMTLNDVGAPVEANVTPQYYGDTSSGRMWNETRVFQRSFDFDGKTKLITVSRLPNVSRLLNAWVTKGGSLALQFHISKADDWRHFDRRFVVLKDGDPPPRGSVGLVYELDVGLGFLDKQDNYFHIYKIKEMAVPSGPNVRPTR